MRLYENLVEKELQNITDQRWKIIAILVNKKPIAVASNDLNKTHPMVSKYNKLRRSHAELRCINKAPVSKLKNSILYVFRWSTAWKEWQLAKPCDMCLDFILKAGIKRVIYSDNNGFSEISCRHI